MKKILIFLLVASTLFALVSCGAENEAEAPLDTEAKPAAVDKTLMFEKSFAIAEGREVALKFFGKDGSVSTIEATVLAETVQTINVSDASRAVIQRDDDALSDSADFRFFTKDMNFDGYTDFAIQAWVKSEGTVPYYCWFWNEAEGEFSFGAELEDPFFDRLNSKIYCFVNEGEESYIAVYSAEGGAVTYTSSVKLDADVSFTSDLSEYEQYMEPADRDGYLILANKETELGENYIPDDLIDIDNTRQDGRATQQMVRCAAMALNALYIEMQNAGYTDVSVTSAYRSYEDQYRIFYGFYNQNLAAGYDEDTALQMVLSDTAYPGTSEHQTGLCCDMHNYPSATTEFKNEDAYKWLTDNAWKFGFILRYPEDKVSITGYTFEPWHYRFVGRYHAERIHALGLCLEEYLELIK